MRKFISSIINFFQRNQQDDCTKVIFSDKSKGHYDKTENFIRFSSIIDNRKKINRLSFIDKPNIDATFDITSRKKVSKNLRSDHLNLIYHYVDMAAFENFEDDRKGVLRLISESIKLSNDFLKDDSIKTLSYTAHKTLIDETIRDFATLYGKILYFNVSEMMRKPINIMFETLSSDFLNHEDKIYEWYMTLSVKSFLILYSKDTGICLVKTTKLDDKSKEKIKKEIIQKFSVIIEKPKRKSMISDGVLG